MINTQLIKIIWKASTNSTTSPFSLKAFMMVEKFVNNLFCCRIQSLPYFLLNLSRHFPPLFSRNPHPEVSVHNELRDIYLFYFFI